MSIEINKYWCGRCGLYKVIDIGHTCEVCKNRDTESNRFWSELKCSKCGKQAIGYNINGAFCSNDHYPFEQTFVRIEDDCIVGMDIR